MKTLFDFSFWQNFPVKSLEILMQCMLTLKGLYITYMYYIIRKYILSINSWLTTRNFEHLILYEQFTVEAS